MCARQEKLAYTHDIMVINQPIPVSVYGLHRGQGVVLSDPCTLPIECPETVENDSVKVFAPKKRREIKINEGKRLPVHPPFDAAGQDIEGEKKQGTNLWQIFLMYNSGMQLEMSAGMTK